MDACEFFMASITEAENLDPFLKMITDLMIEFTDMQIELIGKELTLPGHIMLSSRSLKGISISDDNMAVISPASYQATSLPYNKMLSKYYGGISIHSCGNWIVNSDLLLSTENLFMVDCAIGKAADPTPNDAEKLKQAFLGSDTILKVRLGHDEIDLLEKLIDPRVKLIIQLCTDGTVDERNMQYEIARERILKFWLEQPKCL